MQTDLPPMEPCPVQKSGRHELLVITPSEDDHDMTLACHRCGALRRVPVTGAINLGPLDDQPAWAIIRAAQGD